MPISKSTLFFSLLSFGLGALVLMIVSQLAQSKQLPTFPHLATTIKFGLAADKQATAKQFRAVSVLLWDTDEQKILWQQNAFERRPLASITKLMTAIVALDYGIPWDKQVTILPGEYGVGGQLQLFSGETVSMKDLVNASLVGSANNATLAYVRELGLPQGEFILAMNRKAVSLGLEQTEFKDVTGLDLGNVSNAYEIARLAAEAFTNYPDIARITAQKDYSFTISGSEREHTIRNTNKLISESGLVTHGSKTGYLYESQYCLVVQGEGNTAGLVAVVLGSPSEAENFADVLRLLKMDVAP